MIERANLDEWTLARAQTSQKRSVRVRGFVGDDLVALERAVGELGRKNQVADFRQSTHHESKDRGPDKEAKADRITWQRGGAIQPLTTVSASFM